jgi:transcriptional regulator with XRE-family HTH domain
MPRQPTVPRFANGFGSLIQLALAERRMTQADLAKAMKLSGCWVSRVICGRDLVSQEWVDKAARILKLDPMTRAQLHIENVKLRQLRKAQD